MVDLLTSYAIADFAERAMIEVDWDVMEAGYDVEDMAWVACQVFLSVYRKRFVFSGVSIEQGSGLHPMLRVASTALLAGWVGSKISLKRHKRLSAALAEQGERSFDALLQELPAATFVEWYTARRESSVKGLVSGVTHSLEKLGREAAIRPYKVRDTPPEEAGGTPAKPTAAGEDEDLVKFELEETVRQQLDTLEQVARLSQQQTAIWQRLRRGMEIAEIAAELGISENQVSVQKHNAVQKLIEARKVVGF